LVVYFGLGIDAILKHHFMLSILCFVTPFAGPVGMWIATLTGAIFLWEAMYIESVIAIGLVIFNLFGNKLMDKESRKSGTRI
jgi:hypothetical protein